MSSLERLMGIANRQGISVNDSEMPDRYKMAIKQNQKMLEDLKGVYKDSPEVFQKWKKEPFPLTKETKEYWWSTYESLNPGDTKEEIRNDLKVGINSRKTLAEKDFFIRDSFSKMPKWVSDEFSPTFAAIQSGLNRQTAFKSESAYQRDLESRLSKFAGMGLDPEVSDTQHLEDFLNIERLNLLDVASVQSGRIGVLDTNNYFRPSYAVNSRSQVFETDPYGPIQPEEDVLISSLAPTVMKPFIEMELGASRQKTTDSNMASNTTILDMLRSGRVDRDRWDQALASVEGVDLMQATTAITEGQVSSRKVQTRRDLGSLVFELTTKYGDLNASASE
jgi:hypothetical protein